MSNQTEQPLDLDDAFDDFMRKVNPSVERHEVQYRESRRCFFAGAALVFFHMAHSTSLWGDDKALEELQKVERQLREFALLVKGERD
jgi:hypothetical protein